MQTLHRNKEKVKRKEKLLEHIVGEQIQKEQLENQWTGSDELARETSRES